MAGLNVSKIFLVLGALTRHGFGATLDLTVTPTKTSQLSSEDVYISCRPGTSLQAKSILLIKIRKSGGSSPLAHVYHNHQAVVKNPNTTRGIKAVGHIDENALRESFLSMKLEDPTYEQSGSYECELAYLDVKGKMQVAKTSGDVKVIKPDIRAVDEVIDDLREEDERLNHNSSSQAKINKEQEKKIAANAQDFVSFISSQAKVIKDLEKKIETNAHNFASVTKELHETKAKLQNKKVMKCPNDEWTRVDANLCYKGYKTKVNWQKANETCRKEGGNLVSIHSQFHRDMAQRVVRSAGIEQSFWIGLNEIAEEGKYVFDDGTQMSSSFKPWYAHYNRDHYDCVIQYTNGIIWSNKVIGQWCPDDCRHEYPFVCQASTRLVEFW